LQAGRLLLFFLLVFCLSGLASASLSDGLEAYYPLDADFNNDASSLYNATTGGTVTIGAPGVPDTLSDAAAYFSATSGSAVILPSDLGTALGDDWSINIWYNVTGANSYDNILSASNLQFGFNQLVAGCDTNDMKLCVSGDGGMLCNPDFEHLFNTSVMFTFVAHANKTMVTYINGEVECNTAKGSAFDLSSKEVFIGTQQDNFPRVMNGGGDEVGLWSRGLSGAEVTELYNSGDGKSPLYVPPALNVTISGVSCTTTNTTAWINWTTNITANASVNTGATSGNLSLIASQNTSYTTDHRLLINEGLSPNQTFFYQASSYNSSSAFAFSEVLNCTTQANEPPPPAPPNVTISSLSCTARTNTSFVVTWTTNITANATVYLSPDFNITYENTTFATSHRVGVTGLDPNTTYSYIVGSYNTSSAFALSDLTNCSTTTMAEEEEEEPTSVNAFLSLFVVLFGITCVLAFLDVPPEMRKYLLFVMVAVIVIAAIMLI
jgi:hypothetical protein